MLKRHLEESKTLINELADKVLLNKTDQEADNRMFAPLFKKTENIILSEYLTDLANERIDDFKIYTTDKDIIAEYKNELIIFLQKTLRERL